MGSGSIEKRGHLGLHVFKCRSRRGRHCVAQSKSSRAITRISVLRQRSVELLHPRFRGITGRCIMRIKNEHLEFECFRGQQ